MAKVENGDSTQNNNEVPVSVSTLKPVRRTIVCEVVAYKEVEKRGNMSADSAFVSLTVIGDNSETFTLPINLEFINVAELPKILFEGNAVSVVVEKHIAGKTTYVDKDKIVKVHKEDSEASFVEAVHATTMQIAMGLLSLPPVMQSAILAQYQNVRATKNSELVAKSNMSRGVFGE